MSLLAYARRGKISDSLLSKTVLAPIASGYVPPADLVKHLGLEGDIPKIIELHQRYGGQAGSGEPKYTAFYKAIKTSFEDSFDWQILESAGKPRVVFEKPYINFQRPTLLTLMTCCVRGELSTSPPLMARYPTLRGLPHGLVAQFGKLIDELSFYLPSADYIAAIADLLLKGLAGEEITLVSPVCPDYAFEPFKDRYRYTFSGLGDGIGLVAGRVVRVLPPLQDLLRRHGIQTRLVVAAGDFEGLDEATLLRVRESRDSFRVKLIRSQLAILEGLGRPAQSVFITDLAGGGTAWHELVAQSHAALCGDDFSALLPTQVNLDAVLDARLPLYQAWHAGRSRAELEQVLLHQCAEYAAMGRLFSAHWPNALVVGGDHNRMMPFYWLHQRIPVLYLKRAY